MNPTAPHVEDLLLDFVYGELPDAETRKVRSHLDACAQCAEALKDIQGVRRVMAKLPEPSAPEAGLESLLAYAEQAARRVQAGPAPRPSYWRRLIAPVAGMAGVAVIFVVATTVTREEPQTLSEQAVHAVLKQQAEAPPAPPSVSLIAEDRSEPKQLGALSDEQVGQKAERKVHVMKEKDAPASAARVAPAPAAAPEVPPALEEAAANATSGAFLRREMAKTRSFDSIESVDHDDARVAKKAKAESHAEQLAAEAWGAYQRGDRGLEAALLRKAVALADRDAELLAGLLNRLCDAEYALGNDAAGDAACRRVMSEYSGKGAAQVAERRMRSQRGNAAGAAGAAPAEAAPAKVSSPPERPASSN